MPTPVADDLGATTERRVPKPVRVLVGMTIMALLVATGLWMLTARAGDWGVPYFSFTTDNGTTCTNTWVGHSCEDVTVADFEDWADFSLPEGTTLVTASYSKTSADFEVVAQLRTTKDQSGAFGKTLTERFGPCQSGGFPPGELKDHSSICVVNSRLARGTQEAPLTRRWDLATGVAEDGTRLTLLTFGSR